MHASNSWRMDRYLQYRVLRFAATLNVDGLDFRAGTGNIARREIFSWIRTEAERSGCRRSRRSCYSGLRGRVRRTGAFRGLGALYGWTRGESKGVGGARVEIGGMRRIGQS